MKNYPKIAGGGTSGLNELRPLGDKVVEDALKSNVLSKLTETDIDEWVKENAPVTEEPTDQLLILSVTQPEALDPTKDSDDEEEEEKQENVSWAEAEKGLHTYLMFAEGSSLQCCRSDELAPTLPGLPIINKSDIIHCFRRTSGGGLKLR